MFWGILIAIVAVVAVVTLAAVFARNLISRTIIYAPSAGLHYRDGRFVRLLTPGRYTLFDPFRRSKIVLISTIQQPNATEVPVTSADQFAFKITIVPVLTVIDAQAYHEALPASEPEVYRYPGYDHVLIQRQIAAATIAVIGRMKLPEILADVAAIPAAIIAEADGKSVGIRIDEILVTGIALPPEVRKMFTEVERARQDAMAGIERARGEQAAMRILANAARSMTDNPALANLRLLKAIETSKGPTTIVLGNPIKGATNA